MTRREFRRDRLVREERECRAEAKEQRVTLADIGATHAEPALAPEHGWSDFTQEEADAAVSVAASGSGS